MEKLKPCPFCGAKSSGKLKIEWSGGIKFVWGFKHKKNCYLGIPNTTQWVFEGEADEWNRRADKEAK